MRRLVLASLLVVIAMSGAAFAEPLATYDTYQVGPTLAYPWDFATNPNGTLADSIESATMDVVGATAPGSPAWNQWSAVGFDDGGSFVYTVTAKDGECFDPDLLYNGGFQRSSTGPTSCEVTVSWIDCDNTVVESAVIDTFTIETSYTNEVYDLDALIPELGCDELGCVKWLEVDFYATGATSDLGTFRMGNYYDGSYTNFGVTGESCVPEPTTLGLLLIGGLMALIVRKRRS